MAILFDGFGKRNNKTIKMYQLWKSQILMFYAGGTSVCKCHC